MCFLTDQQQRGLIVMMGLALLAAGVAFTLEEVPRAVQPSARSIELSNIRIHVPRFAPQGKINVNEASLEMLTKLPGIGNALAARIVADRRENGPYLHLEDLIRVPGIGAKTVEGFQSLATVGDG